MYRGLADLVRGLPPELIPSGDQGWDQFQVDNLRQWMTEHPRHQQFSQHLVLTRVTVGRFLGAPKATPWRITLSFRPRQVPLRNMTLTEDIQVSFFATEDLARRAEALTEGTSLGLSGTLERLSFARGFHIGKLQHLMRLHFSQIEVNHPQLRYRGAVAP